MPLGIRAQRARIDAGLAQLAAMADQPAFDSAGIGFQVELQTQHPVADRVGLLHAAFGARQQFTALRQLEAVAVPMQHRHAGQRCQHRAAARIRQRQRAEADLLEAHGGDGGAEQARDQLRAQTNAEQRPAAGQAPFEQTQFVGKKGIGPLVEGADRPTQCNEKIACRGLLTGQVVRRGVEVAHVESTLAQQRFERAEVFEMDVAQGQGGLHAVCSDAVDVAARSSSGQ